MAYFSPSFPYVREYTITTFILRCRCDNYVACLQESGDFPQYFEFAAKIELLLGREGPLLPLARLAPPLGVQTFTDQKPLAPPLSPP